MRTGKLDNEVLNDLILKKYRHIRSEVKGSPMIGMDCAAVDLGGRLAVLSTDPITAADKNIGRLTVNISCNDAAAAGAEPIGMLVTLLAPPSITPEELGSIADELAEAAVDANIDIIGGHTEITESVTRVVTSATVIAKSLTEKSLASAKLHRGDSIVMTKSAGLEGAAIVASDFADRLGEALTAEEIEYAKSFVRRISVVKEGIYAALNGANAMHDITEGGVFGAVWEMAQGAECGVVVDVDAIPVEDVTRKICAATGLDVYKLISSGSMLIACPDGDAMVRGLRENGIEAAVIGKAEGDEIITKDNRPILPPQSDEIYKLF